MINFKNQTALITGASSGIGKSFAHALASRGANLVMVSESKDKIESAAAELKGKHSVKITGIACDLSDPKNIDGLYEQITQEGFLIDILINNAGFGACGRFHEIDLDRDQKMIMVNVAAVCRLTHLFLPPMVERKKGTVINIASTGSFQPTPWWAVYGATKAFVLSFTEALWAEYRDLKELKFLALCPGPTSSNFFSAAGPGSIYTDKMRTPDQVVETGLDALEKGKSYAIDGFKNYLLANASRLGTRKMTALVTSRIMGTKK